jgi:2-polyprenyl-6-methoxyphenol hydroxylase-like FAD-dependent oxidoreductase
MNITIIGGGIGGLTTALSLQQRGFKVSVYEGASEIKPVGAGISLALNAMLVFQKLGLQKALEQAGNRVSVVKITDAQLRPLSVVHLTSFEEKYHAHNLAIHRGDLQRILAEAIGYENIYLSKRLKKVEKTQNKSYFLTFEDNSTLETTILIGADGIKSMVRDQLFEQGRIRDAQQPCWRGVAEVTLPEHYQHEAHEAWGNGARFGFVKINKKSIYWFALTNARHALSKDLDFKTLFQDFHPDIRHILDATPNNQIIRSEITDLYPLKTWHIDHACLIGDAAHATTPNLGQGACQAIEDAYILGTCLAKYANTTIAFQEYEQRRRKKATTIVQRSWFIGKMAHLEHPLAVWLRNALMKATPETVNKRQMAQLFVSK